MRVILLQSDAAATPLHMALDKTLLASMGPHHSSVHSCAVPVGHPWMRSAGYQNMVPPVLRLLMGMFARFRVSWNMASFSEPATSSGHPPADYMGQSLNHKLVHHVSHAQAAVCGSIHRPVEASADTSPLFACLMHTSASAASEGQMTTYAGCQQHAPHAPHCQQTTALPTRPAVPGLSSARPQQYLAGRR